MQAKLTTALLALALSGCATTIFRAAEQGDVSGVAALLDADPALVDASDERTLFALHYAAADGREETVALLLDRGAEPDATALGGMTPLFVAATGGHADVVRLLVNRGADPEARTPWNPIRGASSEGHVQTVRALLELGANPEGHNVPPLMAAAANGHLDVMGLLLDAGAKINRVTLDDFSSALTVAAARGRLDAVEWLVERGANVHHDDAHGRTALTLAVENGHGGVADVLRRHGAR